MLGLIKKLLLVKEIKSKKNELHFRRYILLNAYFFQIYIHRIYQSDCDIHPHNHSFDFISFILKGSYFEELLGKIHLRERFSFKKYKTKDYHRLIKLVDDQEVTTMVLTWNRKKDYKWGYLVNGKHIDFDVYRKLKNNNELV